MQLFSRLPRDGSEMLEEACKKNTVYVFSIRDGLQLNGVRIYDSQ